MGVREEQPDAGRAFLHYRVNDGQGIDPVPVDELGEITRHNGTPRNDRQHSRGLGPPGIETQGTCPFQGKTAVVLQFFHPEALLMQKPERLQRRRGEHRGESHAVDKARGRVL